jgi:predicted nucleotide-binding protein
LAKIDSDLLVKIKNKLEVGKSSVYERIKRTAHATSLPQRVAALLVARDAGVSISRFASDADLTLMRGLNSATVPTANAAPPTSVSTFAVAKSVLKRKGKPQDSKKKANAVFLVHGRNHKARNAVSDFLRSLDVQPIEWGQALALTKKGSPYIGEIIETGFAHAKAVVVLLTPDDEARLKKEFVRPTDPAFEKVLTGQPRQIVLFEAGMALGKYPDTTILVHVGKVREMSDVSGLHILNLTGSATSRKQLISRLKAIGVAVDDSGEDWLTRGDFSGF